MLELDIVFVWIHTKNYEKVSTQIWIHIYMCMRPYRQNIILQKQTTKKKNNDNGDNKNKSNNILDSSVAAIGIFILNVAAISDHLFILHLNIS